MKGLLPILRRRLSFNRRAGAIEPLDPQEERNLERLRRARAARAEEAHNDA